MTKNSHMPASPAMDEHHGQLFGLTKLEWMSAVAMQGILTTVSPNASIQDGLAGLIAKEAVCAAKALLKELERNQ